MSSLTEKQIDFIKSDLSSRPVSRSFLFNEWIDHICSDVESLMQKGMGFEEAYHCISNEMLDDEAREAHTEVQTFLNHKYVRIKKILYLSVIVFAISWLINFQGAANWAGLVSFFILSLVYLRVSTDFCKERKIRRSRMILSLLAFLSFLGTVSGILLLFLNRNYGVSTRGHGVDLTVFAWFFFSVLCLIYYIREWRLSIEKDESRKIRLFVWISGINVGLAAISVATFPLYHLVKDYLFFFILFLLGFNLVMLLLLLLTRSMINTLIVSLITGSFMIIFIHSHFRSQLPGGKPKLHEYTLRVAPEGSAGQEKLFLHMYYGSFPDQPFTVPLKQQEGSVYQITMPSYAFRGYLYYRIERDSSNAMEYFRTRKQLDSIYLRIPRQQMYNLKLPD